MSDFVEAPSQMLENWCWEPEALRRMSSHYLTHKPLPDDLIERLRKSRNANIGLLTQRQLVFGTMDQRMHTRSQVKTEKLEEEVFKDLWPIPHTPGNNGLASFGHLAGGCAGDPKMRLRC